MKNALLQSLKLGLSTLALGALLTACGGNQTQPGDPAEPPDTVPSGCCQLDSSCVQVDEASGCEARGGEFFSDTACTSNECVVQ